MSCYSDKQIQWTKAGECSPQATQIASMCAVAVTSHPNKANNNVCQHGAAAQSPPSFCLTVLLFILFSTNYSQLVPEVKQVYEKVLSTVGFIQNKR